MSARCAFPGCTSRDTYPRPVRTDGATQDRCATHEPQPTELRPSHWDTNRVVAHRAGAWCDACGERIDHLSDRYCTASTGGRHLATARRPASQ